MVNIYSDILIGIMDVFVFIIFNNVNIIMKCMISIFIILMVFILIVSFYGMNVDVYVDVLLYVFSFIILVFIILFVLVFVIFRKIKWF